MLIFWVCVVIAVAVFGAMIYSIVKFRHSQGAVPANFDHTTRAEIVWTVIPIVILVAMAIPAAATLVRIEDTRNSELTIKVTGYQWSGITNTSIATSASSRRWPATATRRGSSIPASIPNTVPNYLLDVDHPLVVPVGKKVRVLLTAGDVIHAWWVPAFGMKKDAIPGFVNELWFRADQVGIYRGQCAELCGRDHGFMPVVVDVRSQADFDSWLQEQQAGAETANAAADSASGVRVHDAAQQHCTIISQALTAHDHSRATRITTITARRRAGAAGCSRPITRTSARCTCCSA